ncbi:hypothetical protein GCM10007895_33360 [Paraferrimonas sedimenticola]|uniref:Serine aminopeptidase S33 domain-containing protein n=2 Tax=Paraferrimonas sedimenticola TaxID=375674 RepID=A0AA37RZ53_9GAMM|nr:hypothetical protein GCM10007895_33360 [Paraferrimonas sedimenticola]
MHYNDDTSSTLLIFATEDADTTFYIFPAMSVWARFYIPLAKSLQSLGVNVVISDHRGHGSFQYQPKRDRDFGYERMVLDCQQVINQGQDLFPNTRAIALGHSLGGQLASLVAARYPDSLQGIVLVASGLVHYKGWSGLEKVGLRIIVSVFPWIAKLNGYFPGNLVGFAGREAMSVMADWGHCGRTGRYELLGSSFDYESAFNSRELPVLGITVEGDTYASQQSTKNLANKFAAGKRDYHHLPKKIDSINKPMDHFNWAKSPHLIQDWISDWLDSSL